MPLHAPHSSAPAAVSFTAAIRVCCLAFAFLALSTMPCTAQQSASVSSQAKPEARRIDWDDAPVYIREQIRNVVMNCTEGTLTPNHANIYEYAAPNQLSHYAYDFTAWVQQPVNGNCQNSPPLCGEKGCLLTAYTQIKPNLFKQSLRTYVLSVAPKEIGERTPEGNVVAIAGFEMSQSKFNCRVLNGGTAPCALNFTWKNNKFTYFGFGAKDDQPAIEPPHEKEEPAPQQDE